MRARLNQFDPMKQTYNRLQSLTTTGHQTDKIEMIILWWSWDAYPIEYKIDFVKQLYDACNTFSELKIKSFQTTPQSFGQLPSQGAKISSLWDWKSRKSPLWGGDLEGVDGDREAVERLNKNDKIFDEILDETQT